MNNPNAVVRPRRILPLVAITPLIVSIALATPRPDPLDGLDVPIAGAATTRTRAMVAQRPSAVSPGLRSPRPTQSQSAAHDSSSDDVPGGLPIFKRHFTYQG